MCAQPQPMDKDVSFTDPLLEACLQPAASQLNGGKLSLHLLQLSSPYLF